MVAIKMLFGTDIGLLSVFTIAAIFVMGFYFWGFVKKHMAEDARSARNAK
jgi:hypothetical protein